MGRLRPAIFSLRRCPVVALSKPQIRIAMDNGIRNAVPPSNLPLRIRYSQFERSGARAVVSMPIWLSRVI